jgi:hypothetical protein
METYDIEKVFEKRYIELTELEKAEFADLFQSEDDFNQLKYTFSQIGDEVNFQKSQISEPSAQIKNNLDDLFHKTYKNKGVLWYNSLAVFFVNEEKNWYNQNLTRIAAILLISLAVLPFLNTNQLQDSQVLTAKNETVSEQNKNEDKASDDNENDFVIEDKNSLVPNLGSPSIDETEERLVVAKPPSLAEAETKVFDSMAGDASFAEDMSASTFSVSPTSAHPDGIYLESDDEKAINATFSLKSNPNFLDLLTPTF